MTLKGYPTAKRNHQHNSLARLDILTTVVRGVSDLDVLDVDDVTVAVDGNLLLLGGLLDRILRSKDVIKFLKLFLGVSMDAFKSSKGK